MIDMVVHLFQAANSLSPLAIIALLVGLLYVVLYQHPQKMKATAAAVDNIRTNDLHEVTDLLREIRIAVTDLQQNATTSQAYFAEILAFIRHK